MQSNLKLHLRHLMQPLTFARSFDSPQRGHTVASGAESSGFRGSGLRLGVPAGGSEFIGLRNYLAKIMRSLRNRSEVMRTSSTAAMNDTRPELTNAASPGSRPPITLVSST